MNIGKIQQEILKALIADNSKVNYFDYNMESTFITTTGIVGYILPNNALRVDLRGAQIMCSIGDRINKTVCPKNRLGGTDEYRRGGTARKYLSADGETETYIDTSLLKNFDFPELYQAQGCPLTMVVVTEGAIGSDAREIVGIVMPVSIKDVNN